MHFSKALGKISFETWSRKKALFFPLTSRRYCAVIAAEQSLEKARGFLFTHKLSSKDNRDEDDTITTLKRFLRERKNELRRVFSSSEKNFPFTNVWSMHH